MGLSITVDQDTDFTTTSFAFLATITFTNLTFLHPATATFSSLALDGSQIYNTLQIVGSSGVNNLIFNGSSANASQWTFVSWSAGDSVTFTGSTGDDIMTGPSLASQAAAKLSGLAGNDTLTGSTGHDSLYGGAGDDVLLSNGGIVAGGAGRDTFVLGGIDPGVALQIDIGDGGGGRTDTWGHKLSGIDRLYGTATPLNDIIGGGGANDRVNAGAGDDSVLGRGGNDILWGYAGDDTIDGGTGNDVINGGGGTDLLTGGTGADRFVFDTAEEKGNSTLNHSDVITDFVTGIDKIDLRYFTADVFNLYHDHLVFLGQTPFSSDYFGVRAFTSGTDTIIQVGLELNVVYDSVDSVLETIRLTGHHAVTANDFIL